MTKEEVAQWAVNNRYPKSENNKISDSEMYHTLIKKIEQAINYTHSCTELQAIEELKWRFNVLYKVCSLDKRLIKQMNKNLNNNNN